MPPRNSSTTTDAPPRAPAGGHGNPGMLILLGLVLLGVSFLIVTLQTQTNEAYISHTQQKEKAIQAQWSVWLQLPKLVFGKGIPGPDISSDDLPGVVIGQVVEIAYVSLIAGRSLTMHTSRKHGRVLGTVIIVLLFLIAIFDFNADLTYGDVSSDVHIIFAVICTFVVGFFPTWGLTLIEHGWKRL